MSVYTEGLVAGLKALSVEGSAVTFAQCEAFAAENGLKVRSVVAKVKSLKLPYEPKPTRVTKAGEPVIHKIAIVAAIETALGVRAPSLEKATKEDLARLFGAVADLVGMEDGEAV
jgi:hypothetical protein